MIEKILIEINRLKNELDGYSAVEALDYIESYINTLSKQDMESYEKIKKVLALGFMNFLDENKPKDKMCLSNGECADIEKAFNEQDWPRLAGYLDKYTESEDERIRKTIVSTIEQCPDDFLNPKNRDKMLAYLERQKEQPISAEEVLARAGLKPYKDGNQWCILAGDNIQEGICGFGDTIEDALYEFLKEVLDLQKEQKPNYCHHEVDETGWTEEYRKAYYDGWNNCNMQHEQLKADHKPAEWSEEDEAMLDSVIRIITRFDDLAHEPTFAGPKWTHPYTKEIAWLKSIRPQPKQEVTDEGIEEMEQMVNRPGVIYTKKEKLLP